MTRFRELLRNSQANNPSLVMGLKTFEVFHGEPVVDADGAVGISGRHDVSFRRKGETLAPALAGVDPLLVVFMEMPDLEVIVT